MPAMANTAMTNPIICLLVSCLALC